MVKMSFVNNCCLLLLIVGLLAAMVNTQHNSHSYGVFGHNLGLGRAGSVYSGQPGLHTYYHHCGNDCPNFG